MSEKTGQISDRQVAALKYFIYKSRYGSKFLKQILFLLIDGSKNLTDEIYFVFEVNHEYRPDEVTGHAQTMMGMLVSHQTTMLNDLLTLAGSDFRFSISIGYYPDQGKSETADSAVTNVLAANSAKAYTIWLSSGYFGEGSRTTRLMANREQIEAVEIFKTGLHPEQESSCSACDSQNHEPLRHLTQP